MRIITCFGDRTCITFLIIASASRRLSVEGRDRRDPAKIPGTHRDPAGISPRWPVFPAGSFLGKIPAAYLGKNLAEIPRSRDPRSKIRSRDPCVSPLKSSWVKKSTSEKSWKIVFLPALFASKLPQGPLFREKVLGRNCCKLKLRASCASF